MNVIDHAILIPASPAFIWRFLGDIAQNPTWQDDCLNVSFLTTQHEGKGARWRYAATNGNDIIVEITAWYDTLGYEYVIVEGASVSDNKGRIRLQEVAEGTLVQWTFNYELQGIFSGLRNSLGLKRSLTNLITNSLRNLYKVIQNETGGISTHEAKALLKAAPGVDERSAYEPRHPSNFREQNVNLIDNEPDYPSEQSITYDLEQERILEPPAADEDTKPNPVVQDTSEIPVAPPSAEPSFLNAITEPPIVDEDTQPNPTISDEEISSPISESGSTFATETVESETVAASHAETSTTPSPDIRDTSTVSVFDVFGLVKPSTTEEIRAITDAELEGTTTPDTQSPEASLDESEQVKISSNSIPADTIAENVDGPKIITPEEAVEINSGSNETMEAATTLQDKLVGLRLELRRKIELRHRK